LINRGKREKSFEREAGKKLIGGRGNDPRGAELSMWREREIEE